MDERQNGRAFLPVDHGLLWCAVAVVAVLGAGGWDRRTGGPLYRGSNRAITTAAPQIAVTVAFLLLALAAISLILDRLGWVKPVGGTRGRFVAVSGATVLIVARVAPNLYASAPGFSSLRPSCYAGIALCIGALAASAMTAHPPRTYAPAVRRIRRERKIDRQWAHASKRVRDLE